MGSPGSINVPPPPPPETREEDLTLRRRLRGATLISGAGGSTGTAGASTLGSS